MRIEWDEHKNRANKYKHWLCFETAQQVFDDPHALTIQDRYVWGEERWQTLGLVNGVIVVLVAHTHQETVASEVIRIISARKANKQDRYDYE